MNSGKLQRCNAVSLIACTFPACECPRNPIKTEAQHLADKLNGTAGVKHDTSKPDFSLLSPLALSYLTAVLDFGARKYAAHNWRKGIDQTRLIAAAMRHINAFNAGEDLDLETGLPHMAHAMCCCMFSIEQMYAGEGKNPDSRYKLSYEQRTLLVSLLAGEVPSKVE